MVSNVAFADWLSIAAFFVSSLSLAFSLYVGLRDRSALIVRSGLSVDTQQPYILVTATNHGRRPVLLHYLSSTYEDGNHGQIKLRAKNKPILLNEGESHEIVLAGSHPMLVSKKSKSKAVNLWVYDSLNKKYEVRNAKSHLRRFFTRIGRTAATTL